MQYSRKIAIVAAFAGLANAQSQCLSSAVAIPPCALGYIASVAYSTFSCGLVDFACDCSNLEGIANTAIPILGNAQTDCNINSVLTSALALCSCATEYAPSSVSLNPVESACQPSAAALPACALGYLASAGANLGCALNNFECQCSNFNAIEGAIVNDVVTACGAASLNAVIQSANALCSCVTSAGAAGPGSSPATSTTALVSVPTSVATPSGSLSVPSVTGGSLSIPSVTGGSLSIPSVSGGSLSIPGVSAPTGTGAMTSQATTAGVSKQGPSGSGSLALPTFTGAGATASAFGGIFGVVAGLVALL